MTNGIVGGQNDLMVDGQRNERTVTYGSAGAVHHIRFFNQVSPEVLLVHQSRMVGFNLRLQSKDELEPISREVKSLLLRDHGKLPGVR
jgi:hypothetical protein